jgi:hypothetical protein
MESSGLCLQHFIGMGNFPRNCQWMKLEIGNLEKIELGNRVISLASYGKSIMQCSFPKMGLPFLWVVGCQSYLAVQSWIKWDVQHCIGGLGRFFETACYTAWPSAPPPQKNYF